MTQKSHDRETPSRDMEVRALTIQEVGQTIRVAIQYITYAVIAVCGVFAVWTLSGKETDADIAVKLVASSPIKFGSYVLLVLILIVWALGERAVRRRKTEYLTGRIRQLEKERDRGRSSSNLHPSGATNPEDKQR